MAAISPAFPDFFRELAANNNREWFQANKHRYEQQVKLPFYELVAELIELAGREDPGINLEVKNAVFRIFRDVRFSKDKSPYKLHMAAIISRAGRKDMQTPGLYVQLEAERLMIAGGCYKPDKENLARIRRHIISHPDQVAKLSADPSFNKYFHEIGGDRNKILPAEFKEYGDRFPIIYHKQYFYYTDYDGRKYITRKDLPEFIMEHYRAGKGWMDFLREAVTA